MVSAFTGKVEIGQNIRTSLSQVVAEELGLPFEAITVAQENAEINGVADDLELEVNKLSSFHGQDFDAVLANLTADVIVPLAADFAKVIKPQGTLIVSGVLREQAEEVRAALGEHGFEVIEAKPDHEWITLALRSRQ